jgi:hypothetical protein
MDFLFQKYLIIPQTLFLLIFEKAKFPFVGQGL